MKEYVDLYYKNLEITITTDYHPPVIGGAWGGEPAWYDVAYTKVDYTYEVKKDLITEALMGLGESKEKIADDFDAIFEKHESKLLELFRDRATVEAEENYDYGYDDLEPLEIKEKEL